MVVRAACWILRLYIVCALPDLTSYTISSFLVVAAYYYILVSFHFENMENCGIVDHWLNLV